MAMSLPALGCMWPLYFLLDSFQRWALKRSKWVSRASWGSLKGMQFVIWTKICKSGMAFSAFPKRNVTQQLLFVTVSKVLPFNSWQEIQREVGEKEGRGTAYGKWNDSSDQNKLFLVSLEPDLIISLCQLRQLLKQRQSRWKSLKEYFRMIWAWDKGNSFLKCVHICVCGGSEGWRSGLMPWSLQGDGVVVGWPLPLGCSHEGKVKYPHKS